MGRRRTHHDATRTKIVSARLKHETYDLISEHAQKLGLSRAGYIEHLIENRPLRIVRPLSDELPMPLLNELKRIGNNLNQMAHARNAGLDVDPRQFRTVVSEIIATICSNEVLKRRYDGAVTELGEKRGAMIEDELKLLKRTAPASTLPKTSPSTQGQRPVAPVMRDAPSPLPDRDPQRPVKKDDPKTSSPWFKLPRGLHLRSSRR